MVEIAQIEAVALFRDLTAGARRELAARSVVRRFAPGEALWRTGAEPRGLFVLLEGQVRVVKEVNGRRHVIHGVEAGETFGEVPLFGGGRYPASAIAARRSVCLVVTRDAVAAALREDAELAFLLLGRLAQRVRNLIARLDAVTAGSVRHRLAVYLLERQAAASGAVFTLGCSQAVLAEELGTVREVVVRALRELRSSGCIRDVGRGRFEVMDGERLRSLAAQVEREGPA